MRIHSLDDLKTGSVYRLSRSDSIFPLHVEILRIEISEEANYIIVYNLFSRKEEKYIYSNDGTFSSHEKTDLSKKLESPVEYNWSKGRIQLNAIKTFSGKIITVLLISIMVLTINPGFSMKCRYSSLQYYDFLESDLTIPGLYKVVTTRLSYRYDTDEEWLYPETAWNSSYGDCEEYAVLFAMWCRHNSIECHIIALNDPKRANGHAVAFARSEGWWFMLDGTRAIERSGFRRLNVPGLKEAIKLYSTRSAVEYDIPRYNGDKRVIATYW
jgi:hypothetical protein